VEVEVRVLLLADGRSVHTVRYQRELKRQGVEIILASLERGETVDVQLKKKSVSNSLNYFFVNREISELVRKTDPDLVNPHFASGYGFSTAVSRAGKNRPVILHCLGSDILVSPKKSVAHKRKVIFALSKASHILVDSNFLAGKVSELYKSANIDVIPWGVEQEILDLYDSKAKTETAIAEPLKVLVPRPHNPVYNNLFIIEALKELINEGRLSLFFPNWGDDRDKFKAEVSRLCPNGGVEYYDFKPRDEYISFLGQFDIYLSAAYSDSSPASLIEAMAAGLYPVAADIPGVREWLDGSNGVLYPPNDRGALADVFKKAMARPDDLAGILSANHERVKATAVISDNIKKTIEIMERLISGERR